MYVYLHLSTVEFDQQIGKALLPTSGSSKALPAPPTEESPPAAAESVSNVSIATPPKEEAAPPEAAPVINSVAKTEVVKEEAPTATPRPLSPYPNVISFSYIVTV